MLSRAFIDKVRLPAHDQDRPMFAVSRPYGKATLDQLPARAIQSRAAGVNVLLQGQVRLRQGQTSKLAADIIDRKSVVEGKGVSVRVDCVGRGGIKKKKK